MADPNVSIQESKALTGNIEPGRKSKMRRAATSGRLGTASPEKDDKRDLPAVGERPTGTHGLEAPESKEGEQA